MNKNKQLKKLAQMYVKAETCDNRQQAAKLIRKAEKITKKLSDV